MSIAKPSEEGVGPIVPPHIIDANQNIHARQELRRSIQLGLYTPPPL